MNIRTNKFILLLCTLIIKFAIAGCFHSKCTRNQGQDGLSTDGSTYDLLSRDDEQSRLLPEVEKKAALDIKLDCKEYKPGNVYLDTYRGIEIYIPTTTTVEKNGNTYTYSNVLPTLTRARHLGNSVYNFARCDNVKVKSSGHSQSTERLYFSDLSTIKGKKIHGYISILTKDTVKKTAENLSYSFFMT